MKRILISVAIIIFCFGPAGAKDYYVDGKNGSNSSGDGTLTKPWKSITYALSQVNSGTDMHTIHVAAGTYDTSIETFPVAMKNKISLEGGGRDNTILDAQGTETVIRFENVSDPGTKIEGFTIMNGQGQYVPGEPNSGGIQIVNSSPSIINNIIRENKDSYAGNPGIRCYSQSSPVIQNNLFDDNGIEIGLSWEANVPSNPVIQYNSFEKCGITIVGQGTPFIEGNTIKGNSNYAIQITPTSGASPIITKNVITDNTSSVTVYCRDSSPTIEKNIIANNSGSAIVAEIIFSSQPVGPSIINNTINGNSGDGIICRTSFSKPNNIPLIKNNIISNNTGYGIKESDANTDMSSVRFNLFYHNTNGHYLDEGTQIYTSVSQMDAQITECKFNLEGDPMFVDAANKNWHLRAGSPANNTGDPNGPADGDGTRADIGALPLYDWSGPPNTPKNLRAISGHSQVSLLWSPVPDEDLAYYKVYRSQTNGFIPSSGDSIGKVNTPDSAYLNIGLRNAITYYYRICAVDLTGQKSGLTDQVSAVPTFNPDFFLVSSPTDKAFVNKTPVLIKGVAVNPYIKKVEINGIQVPTGSDLFEQSVNLNEGTNNIHIVGYDSLDIVAKEINLTIKLDATPPMVKISSPITGQSFSYSPVKVQGTLTEDNLVSVFINGINAKFTDKNFVLGENQDEGLDIGEGWYWIKAVAKDSVGNIGTDSVQINGVPPSPVNLYVKSDKLSRFPFPPYPLNTTEGWSVNYIFDQTTWKIPLKGDIQGSTYGFSLLVGCYGLGSATMIADLILKHNNDELILASTPGFTGSMAGWTPFGYWGPGKKEFTVEGIDPNSTIGDTLILKVTKTGGDRVGLIFIHELNDGHSYIILPGIINHVTDHEIDDLSSAEFKLYQNYPNPFKQSTTIKYKLSKSDYVTLKIYNLFGQEIETLVDDFRTTGEYELEWNPGSFSSGIYFCRLHAGQFSATNILILQR